MVELRQEASFLCAVTEGLSDSEKSRKIAAYYEKARYSDKECSSEDVRAVRNLLK